MSHVAVSRACRILSLDAVRLAAKNMGLVVKNQAEYRCWQTDHGGRSYGDYAIPTGFKEADIGKNAVMVLALAPKAAAQALALHGTPAYELGIVEDPLQPGSYLAMHDFFLDGYGLCAVIGTPTEEDRHTGEAAVLAPRFVQHYKLAVDALAAAEAGDRLMIAVKDGSRLVDYAAEGLPADCIQTDGSIVSYTVADEERLRMTL